MFKRNRLAFEVDAGGQIVRLGPPVVRDLLDLATFDTGDSDLDEMLRRSVALFRSPEPQDRRDALEKLWDAYERLKSTKNPGDKKDSIKQPIASTGLHTKFGERLDADMDQLTKIGNDFRIRHAEVSKVPIETGEQVDYLFSRLFSVIWLLLQSL